MTNTKNVILWLWSTSRGTRLQACVNACISVCSVLLDFAFIASTKWAVDIATGRTEGNLRHAAYALVGIVMVRLLISFGSKWVAAILGVRAQNNLRARLFSHLMNGVWQGREAMHTGDVMNRLEHDVRDITVLLTEQLPAMLAVAVRLGGAFLFLYSMDHALPFVLLCISPTFILLSKIYVKRMRALSRVIRQSDSMIQSFLQESLQHSMVVKTLERVHTIVLKLKDMQGELHRQVRKRTLFSSTSSTLLGAGFSIGYLVAFLWGVTSMQEGRITYGMMLAFIQLVGQIQSPFREMSRYVPLIVACLTAAERLMELEKTKQEETGEPLLLDAPIGVALRHVDFAYGEGCKHVIKDLTLDFPPASVTAVMGETGAGKTTLIRLILALVQPTGGSVELYDAKRSICASPRTRANIIYIPQGNTLLSDTIRNNLLLGNPLATDEEMREALRLACADFVMELPEGLDTRCGEQGVGLSEGQSQRIAIARSLLRKGQLLILDEATSALDKETEERLLHNLLHAPQQQTVICITHRTAVCEYCSQVIRIG